MDAPKVHEEGQKRTFLTPLEFAAFLEASRKAGPIEHAAAALMGLSGLRVAEMCSLRVESLSQVLGSRFPAVSLLDQLTTICTVIYCKLI